MRKLKGYEQKPLKSVWDFSPYNDPIEVALEGFRRIVEIQDIRTGLPMPSHIMQKVAKKASERIEELNSAEQTTKPL